MKMFSPLHTGYKAIGFDNCETAMKVKSHHQKFFSVKYFLGCETAKCLFRQFLHVRGG